MSKLIYAYRINTGAADRILHVIGLGIIGIFGPQFVGVLPDLIKLVQVLVSRI